MTGTNDHVERMNGEAARQFVARNFRFSGDFLRMMMERRHVTLRRLEKMSGVPNALLSQYRTGRVQPGCVALYRIAWALGTPMHEFITDGEGI